MRGPRGNKRIRKEQDNEEVQKGNDEIVSRPSDGMKSDDC